ncbi:hypothetical protein DP73_13740 [Desulfosporosinus sp. HMP52]|nr:ArsC/Spx/MgsR family protein [Desulfosporosinus sp. HMP52]KGK88154.1 hypothetical protein DP73_13740 [Desulfosporosinus sp. HMP52]
MELEYRNIVKKPLTVEELIDLAKLGEVSILSLLNKRSKTYKELGKELQESDEMAVADFLATNPKAIIRPLVVENNKLTIGFKPEPK